MASLTCSIIGLPEVYFGIFQVLEARPTYRLKLLRRHAALAASSASTLDRIDPRAAC
jgi:hypothetical protein